MRSLIKWSPISEFHDVTNQLSNLMNFGQRPYLNDESQVNEELDWTPAVNVTENELRYKIDLEVPGVKKEDIQVGVENGKITITGERKSEKEVKNEKIHRTEFSVGKFSRSFKVPQDAESSAIAAKFENGILGVSLPKVESSKPRKVQIEVS